MTVRRVVPVLTVDDLPAATAQYADMLRLKVVMDHGWIVTLADDQHRHQLSLMTKDATAQVNPVVSVEVDSLEALDAAHESAVSAGLQIVHPLSDEEWGVRRFFFADASGKVVNVLAHR
ncbi:VOC family protein [Mycolicibacterium confluentis]|uniref:VOC family protein n=1 Tax=Mycolicibacterium confluentis TaxID=28047 RepID=UPI000A1485AF|nr:VOC family protein [Mycolicibacterium confluentis]MCV7318626.1 VOC family protein [Mycolicibacterium confluentis]ORV33696.1 glyoxalase [Mycolicibacterium confluentis]